MARRRLNKKAALIGSTVCLLAALFVVVVILGLSREPARFIADGDAAYAARDYESARRNYIKAYGLTRSSDQKIDLLFKLTDVYRQTNQWRKVLGCWEQIVTADPDNLTVRLGRLKYAYILADSLSGAGQGIGGYWEEVHSQATDLLGIAKDAGVLEQPKATWEPSFGAAEEPGWDGGATIVGPYLHFAKGRAAYELARLGAVTSPDELLTEAQSDLQTAKHLDPNNTEVYRYLAEVFLARSENALSRGRLDERDEAARQASDVLAQGVDATASRPDAYINLLRRKLTAARQSGIATAREQMQELEPEYLALQEKFPSSAKVHAAVAECYSICAAYSGSQAAAQRLDQAIAAAQKASVLDAESVAYARLAAGLYYRRFSLYGDEADLNKAIASAESALELPDAQAMPGPRQYARQARRLSLCSFLARCYVGHILASDESSLETRAMLGEAEEVVHEIEQIRGSGENPQVVMWHGMLELAKGHTSTAIKDLYAAYEQIKASHPPGERDAYLSYTLAQIFKGTTEVGAVIEFLGSAINSGIVDSKPAALLDYAEALSQARSHDAALRAVAVFDEQFGANDRSTSCRIGSLIAAGHITQAEEALAGLNPDDPNVIVLNLELLRAKASQLRGAIYQERSAASLVTVERDGVGDQSDDEQLKAMEAELRDYRLQEADLTERVLHAAPDALEEYQVAALCETLIEQGDAARAEKIVTAFLEHAPDNVTVLVYRGLLSEPEPSVVSADRRRQIQEQAIRRLADATRQAMELGLFYQQSEQMDDAIAQWRKVLDATGAQSAQDELAYLRRTPLSPRHVAASHLFDVARYREDWPLAEEIVKIAQEDDLDNCGGHLFAARLAFARGQNEDALTHVDECLRQRPIFSYGYMLRGNVHAALGDEHASVDDLSRATGLNPVDPLVAKALANALYLRDDKLGDEVSSQQETETKRALERAIHLNPRDTGLLGAYAAYIADSEPLKALALRQTIQANAPNLHNAVVLGKLATQIALKEADQTRKQAFFTIAETAFEQAKQMEPDNQFMLDSYADYYRLREQNEKAQALLVESDDSQLLWRHYFRVGRYGEAKKLLQEMYRDPANKVDALKGMVLVAEETGDKEGVRKHSEELLSLEDNLVNRLAQIRAYLDVGLVRDAEYRLQSFKERFPNEPRILLMEALLAKRQGQLKRAYELTNRNLERNEQHAAAWRLRGEICLLMGDYDQAILDFRKSRLLEDHPVTTVAMAKAYVWAGRDDEAITELERTLDTPGTPREARLLLESIYQRLGRTESLQRLYTETLEKLPDSVDWLIRAGKFVIAQRQYPQAEELFEKAYRLKQQDTSGRAVAEAVRDRQYAEALDGYLRALILRAGESPADTASWHPEKLDKVFQEGGKYVETVYAPVAFYRMAEAKKRLGDTNAAADYCRKAVDRSWDNERVALDVLLRVYFLMGDEAVSTYCRERLQTNPDSLAANFTMFNLAKLQGQYSDAVDYIDKCIQLCDPETAQHVQYMVKKAEVLTAAHKKTSDNAYLEKAIDVYESLLAKMPKNSSVLNNLAYMLAQSDRKLPESLEYAKQAVEQRPDEANYLDTYGYVLYKNGKHIEAAQALAAAIQQYEVGGAAPAEVHEHMGMVHEALGENAKALVAYRRALELGGNSMPEAARGRLNSAISRLTP